MKKMSTYMMFVYGTLKQGQPNHFLMENAENGIAKYLGNAHTSKKYPLVIASQFNIPFTLYKENTGKNIRGEVFEVDDKMLEVLDDLEGHPNFYERDQIPVKMADSQTERQCWCYFLKKYKPKMLDLPYLESYDTRGNHGLPFIEKCDREDIGGKAKDDVYQN